MSSHDSGFWFASVDIKVLTDKNLSPIDKVVYGVLCAHADTNSKKCILKIETIAEEACCSARSVKNSLRKLAERGIIKRTERFFHNRQVATSYEVIGYKAECYAENSRGAGDSPLGCTSCTQNENLYNDIKDSLTREARLPKTTDSSESPEDLTDAPIVFENGQPADSPKPDSSPKPEESHNPNEIVPVEDVPSIMQPTAKYFLHETGRKAFTWEEISAFRELSATQYPTRIQKEIDTAVKRFTKRGQSLLALTVQYIAGSLRTQPTRNYSGQSVKKRKPDIQPEHPELAPNVLPEVTPEESAALEAEIAAHPELWG